jgi:TonB family protein
MVASSQPAPPEAPAAAARAAVYSALDTHVTGPVALLQAIPRVPANLALSMRASKRTGVLEVTIDERGRVETALIRESVNPVFDGMVVSATKSWEYRPARLEGQPVRYLKRIAFTLQ